MNRRLTPAALAIVIIALAGCGRLNRAATLNQVTTTSGAVVAAALQQELANHGLSAARVTCARRLIVNVGTTTSCVLTGAGNKNIVRFTFSSSHGAVKSGSVTPSS